ncbi:sensor histidine kinase [Paenibacillus dendritiformis]|uniref:sensor histidine kinase n=1 Tax=Paenibacillus dendritiformis TaxID=130049 RepID=UPI003669C9D7
MKSNYRLVLRLAVHILISLVLLCLIASAGLILLTEWLLPQEGEGQDLAVLIGLLAIFAFFVIVYGWFIGKPLLYIMGWINRLAAGIYVEPDNHQRIYTDTKLKRPYRLYEELIVQLHALSDVLETSRQERRRLEARKKEWVAGISHDLKTPLTYIKGYSSMLLSPRHDWSMEEKTKFLTEIQQKADHMQNLIGDLNLSFRLDEQQIPVQLEKNDLVEFVRRIVVDVANDPRAADYQLSFEADATYIEALLDAKLLQRALHNLLINAILHNPAGTNVHIRIAHSPEVHIVIADDGAGMDEEAADRLFHKYYRGTSTNILSEGTGLGMAIARQFVLAHGGDIHAESRLHEGTSITVTLPQHN